MDSSDRLDALVERARALFETKYGSSKGCFAAFSPARVNLMGDFVEGSGGLVLQMTIDRRVVVFGRGRVLPELTRNDAPISIVEKAPLHQELQENHSQVDKTRLHQQHTPQDQQQQQQQTDGKQQGHRQTGRGRLGSVASDEEFMLQPVPRWPRHGKKVGVMDTMVQDLVFGRKGRGSSLTAAPTDSASSTPGGAEWMRFKGSSGPTPSSPVPSSSRHSSRHGGGSAAGGSRGRTSWSPTPSTTRDDSSSRHSSARSSAPTPSDVEGVAGGGGSSAAAASKVNLGSAGSNMPTVVRSGGMFNVPTIQVPGPSPEEIMVSRAHSGSVDSGSTTTEEAFPADSSGFGGGVVGSDETVRVKGVGSRYGANGGGGSSSVGTAKSVVAGSAGSGSNVSGTGLGPKSLSRSNSSGSSRRCVSSRDAAAGTLSETDASAHGMGSGNGNVGADEGGVDMQALPVSQSGSEAAGPPSMHGSASSPRPSAYGSGAGGRPSVTTEGADVEGLDTDGGGSRLDEGELARALAQAEMEAAEAAEMESARLRACRVYCEACPKDGVVEFVAERAMRAGDSWQGLVKAVAAEYIQEVRSGEILGLEAVVVSDLPGLVGQAAASSAQELKVAQEGAGHGWAETARSALLMATATFLEEVLDMGRFPRMKALRCFSAALRCRRSTEHKGEKKGWSGAASTPFGSEETIRATDSSSGGSAVESPGDEAATYEYGISLEDLLAIADDDPPGAVLLDSKTRTYWPIPMKGPVEKALSVVVAQPLDLETAQRLRWQAEHERERGSATCRAVVAVARERHPEAVYLRDVPGDTFEALLSVGTSRGQSKVSSGSSALNSDMSWSASRSGGGDKGVSFASSSGLLVSSSGGTMAIGAGHGRGAARRRLTPEVLAHARHLAAEVQRVREVAAAFTVGDMDTIVRVMLQSRRSAALSVSGSRGRPEPPEPAAVRLAQMVSRLPGVYASRQSEGRGSGAAGAVVALVEPDRVEGIMKAIAIRGISATGVAWGGFSARPGGGSGIVRVV